MTDKVRTKTKEGQILMEGKFYIIFIR